MYARTRILVGTLGAPPLALGTATVVLALVHPVVAVLIGTLAALVEVLIATSLVGDPRYLPAVGVSSYLGIGVAVLGTTVPGSGVAGSWLVVLGIAGLGWLLLGVRGRELRAEIERWSEELPCGATVPGYLDGRSVPSVREIVDRIDGPSGFSLADLLIAVVVGTLLSMTLYFAAVLLVGFGTVTGIAMTATFGMGLVPFFVLVDWRSLDDGPVSEWFRAVDRASARRVIWERPREVPETLGRIAAGCYGILVATMASTGLAPDPTDTCTGTDDGVPDRTPGGNRTARGARSDGPGSKYVDRRSGADGPGSRHDGRGTGSDGRGSRGDRDEVSGGPTPHRVPEPDRSTGPSRGEPVAGAGDTSEVSSVVGAGDASEMDRVARLEDLLAPAAEGSTTGNGGREEARCQADRDPGPSIPTRSGREGTGDGRARIEGSIATADRRATPDVPDPSTQVTPGPSGGGETADGDDERGGAGGSPPDEDLDSSGTDRGGVADDVSIRVASILNASSGNGQTDEPAGAGDGTRTPLDGGSRPRVAGRGDGNPEGVSNGSDEHRRSRSGQDGEWVEELEFLDL